MMIDTEREYRRTAAGRFVHHLKLALPADGYRVHWDDSDAEDRRFWVHVAVTGSMGSPRSGAVVAYARRIRTNVHATARMLGRITVGREWRAVFEQGPKAEYYKAQGERFFSRYSGCTWVYVLHVS